MIFNALNASILALIFFGVWKRGEVRLHVRIMKASFALDVLLLIAVELGRSAIEKTIGIETVDEDVNVTMLWIHIFFALSSPILWIIQLRVGSRVLRGDRSALPRHRRNATAFLVARTLNLVTAVLLHV